MHILLPLLLAIPITHSLILPNFRPPLRPSSPLPQNLSSTIIPGINGRAPTFCKANSHNWHSRQHVLDVEDCITALHRLYTQQVQPHLREDFEFLAPWAVPRFGKWPRVAVTPRKYVHGNCVLAIAMINFYPPSVLRERGAGPFEDNDLARYLMVWVRLHDIIFQCQAPGWGAVGGEGEWGEGIGAFVWTKDSEMDRRTPSQTI